MKPFVIVCVKVVMPRESTIFHDSLWEEPPEDALSYGYDGAVATSGTNVGINHNSKMGVVSEQDQQTYRNDEEHIPPLSILSQTRPTGQLGTIRVCSYHPFSVVKNTSVDDHSG
jgi:hypothetical protein